MKAKVVIGAGFGDEGKGLFTDYFSSMTERSVVIRFNGGAQAGHTVTTPEGKRHVFSHFTSNLFLDNARCYFSKYFIVNPVVFFKELNELNELGIKPVIAAHDDCYITTPYDMMINQWLEKSRGDHKRHGSCGLGIGETIHRSEVANKPLQLKDTESLIRLREKMIIISNFFEKRVRELGLQKYYKEAGIILHEKLIDRFMEDIIEMKRYINIGVNNLKHSFFKDYEIIFEGAQGLMLDQVMGDFPHVTRSNTGLKNVIQICNENDIKELDVLYATRCYKTRHGAGVLSHELTEKPYPDIKDKTNIPNEYQGTLRFAYLDVNELLSYIKKDIDSIKNESNKIKINKIIGITCLDQTREVSFYLDGRLEKCNSTNFKEIFENRNFKTIESYGLSRKTIKSS